MRSKFLLSAALVAASAIAVVSAANAAPLITNGDFETTTYVSSTQFGNGTGFGNNVTGWTGVQGLTELYIGGTQTTVNAANVWNDPHDYFRGLTNPLYPTETGSAYNVTVAPAPDGGNFVAIDGDPETQGEISQLVTGLTQGQTYALTFDWAAAQLLNSDTPYTIQLNVGFGGSSQSTANLSEGAGIFGGWHSVTMDFTAGGASQLLTFMAQGGPAGVPPMALLDSVSLRPVPEPASWAMMIIGFGAIGLAMRRRSRTLVVA
jgi:hypothetical protein